MNVLNINNNYTISSLHQLMIEHLSSKGVTGTVFAPINERTDVDIAPDKNVIISRCFKYNDRYVFDLKQAKIVNALQKSVPVNKFNIIHAYTLFTDGNCARIISKKVGIPYVVAIRNCDVNDFFKKLFFLRRRGVKIMLDAAAVFFLSSSYKDQILQKYVKRRYKDELQDKIHIIPNGIDDFWLTNKLNYIPTDRLIRLSNKQLKLLYVGSIDSNKNVFATVRAVDILVKLGWHVTYTVVGPVLEREIFEAINKLECVRVLPKMGKEELLNVYRENDIFVMASHYESFGLVYAEAMSQGLPVIYTKGQGFDGQFTDGYVGYCVDDKNPKDIAEKITLITDDYTRFANAAMAGADNFCWDTICERYVMIYNKVLSSTDNSLAMESDYEN